jgi:hypothetical protein
MQQVLLFARSFGWGYLAWSITSLVVGTVSHESIVQGALLASLVSALASAHAALNEGRVASGGARVVTYVLACVATIPAGAVAAAQMLASDGGFGPKGEALLDMGVWMVPAAAALGGAGTGALITGRAATRGRALVGPVVGAVAGLALIEYAGQGVPALGNAFIDLCGLQVEAVLASLLAAGAACVVVGRATRVPRGPVR